MKHVLKTIVAVSIFAIAMAYLESTIVVYLRHIYGITDLLKDLPTKPDQYTMIEIGREFCTLAMIFLIGWIAGKNRQERFAYFVIIFGIWDIFYYFWLIIFIGWPVSLMEWDILFLIPLPWWGPVLSPVLISLLMITAGVIAVIKSYFGVKVKFRLTEWIVFGLSILLALYVFMEDAIAVLPGGTDAVAHVRPVDFNWPLFLISLSGMIFLIFRIIRQKRIDS